MSQRFDTQELRRQVGVMHDQIPTDLAARPDTSLNDYYTELQGQFAPEAVRTALWDLISEQTLGLQHPGNIVRVTELEIS